MGKVINLAKLNIKPSATGKLADAVRSAKQTESSRNFKIELTCGSDSRLLAVRSKTLAITTVADYEPGWKFQIWDVSVAYKPQLVCRGKTGDFCFAGGASGFKYQMEVALRQGSSPEPVAYRPRSQSVTARARRHNEVMNRRASMTLFKRDEKTILDNNKKRAVDDFDLRETRKIRKDRALAFSQAFRTGREYLKDGRNQTNYEFAM